MNELSISGVLSSAWDLTKKHGLIYAVIILVFFLVFGGIGAVMGVGNTAQLGSGDDLTALYQQLSQSMTSNLLYTLVGSFVEAYFFYGLLLCARGKAEGFTSEIFSLPIGVVGKVFVTYLLVSIVVYLGALLCILPGLYLSARLQFAPLALLDNHDLGIDEAIKRSWAMTADDAWTLVGLSLVSGLIAMAGMLACGIGVCYTAVIAAFAVIVAYIVLSNRSGFTSES